MQYSAISGEEQIPLLRPHLFSHIDQRNIKSLPSLRRSAFFMLVPALMLLFLASLWRMWMEYSVGSVALFMDPPPLPNTIAESDDTDCLFRASAIQVPRNQPGVPSFWNYRTTDDASNDDCVRQLQPIRVSYDERAIRLNDERVLLLGGSLHPARLTQQTWLAALDEAVQQGLNLITIYVIWSAHQPFSDEPLDFTLQWNYYTNVDGVTTATAVWDLQQAIREVANHGLFVHIRVGPYVCAEYNYGGIPEWLPLLPEQMSMRRPNAAWMMHMEDYVTRVLAYLQQYKLFAFQGGPIILAQIENEIGSDMEDIAEDLLLHVDAAEQFVAPSSSSTTTSRREETALRNATMQDYADWCGAMAQQLAPEVVWTMCSGLSANNTISTYNGFFENSNDIAWMETYGDTHRIQIDQPALWTEHEVGFQTWGETPDHPTDYVWGKTARAMAFATLRWVARGGSHLNFYMWLGGYNRGRAAAAAITNAYAMEAPLCPSGQRRYPKYLHFQALLWALQRVAPILLQSHSALHQEVLLHVWTDKGTWELNTDVRMFSYPALTSSLHQKDIVDFVENASNISHLVRVPNGITSELQELEMSPYSAILRLNGHALFDSSDIPSKSKSFVRRRYYGSIEIAHWAYWWEPVGVSPLPSTHRIISDALPIEQTLLNVESKVWSDYAWYETDFVFPSPVTLRKEDAFTLTIVAPDANVYVVFLDGRFVGAVESHERSERNVSLSLTIPAVEDDVHRHTLSILSESLGSSNIIGRWGYHNTQAKPKGLVGDVVISTPYGNVSLTDGTHVWRMFPGLYGTHPSRNSTQEEEERHPWIDYLTREILDQNLPRTDRPPEKLGIVQGSYSSFLFQIEEYDPKVKGLFVDINSGRGHVWLNGHDLGRYWNITRGDGDSIADLKLSQRYYFLPFDYLRWSMRSEQWNELIFFDAFGGSHNRSRLLLSWIEMCNDDDDETCTTMEDEVDFADVCI